MPNELSGAMPAPSTEQELRDVILSLSHVKVVGGGSKSALSAGANVSIKNIRGIVEYLPDEYTITVRSGTPLAEIQAALDEQNQYLPFDPPFSAAGATIGGTVAAGVSGPGRFRYGGVRDFLLGVTFLTGDGRLVTGGGKVVKNAAGFDIPKLMVGSLGHWGILTELTFKVFPFAKRTLTATMDCATWPAAVDLAQRLSVAPLDLMCLELAPPNQVVVRFGGQPDSLPERAASIRRMSGDIGWQEMSDDTLFWRDAANLTWATAGQVSAGQVSAEQSLVRMPLTPAQLTAAEEVLASTGSQSQSKITRRYSVGGNLLWLAGKHERVEAAIGQLTTELGREASPIWGNWDSTALGAGAPSLLASRLRKVFDPSDRLIDSPAKV
jgi:glycolate oxidase FAD binding subunit